MLRRFIVFLLLITKFITNFVRISLTTILFQKMYGKSLKTELKSELSSNFLKLSKSLIMPIPHLLAKEANRSIRGPFPRTLLEVLVGMDNSGIYELKEFYRHKFKTAIERDLGGMMIVTRGYKKLALALLQGTRNESPVVDDRLAEEDARELFRAGVNRFGTDDPVFNELLSSRSYEHIRVVFAKYRVEAHEDIEESIRSEMSGEAQDIYLMLVNMIRNPEAYFAEALLRILKGVGTDDDELIKIVTWRSEIDLVEIKEHFSQITDKSLSDYIRSDTSGDFRSLLLAIVT